MKPEADVVLHLDDAVVAEGDAKDRRTTHKPAAKTLAAGLFDAPDGDDGRRNTSYFGIIIVDLSATMPITILNHRLQIM